MIAWRRICDKPIFLTNYGIVCCQPVSMCSLQWRHNGSNGVSNHQPHHCLLNRLFRRRSKKTSKPRITGLCAENSPVTCEFPPQMASNAENISIWWCHHVKNNINSVFNYSPTNVKWMRFVRRYGLFWFVAGSVSHILQKLHFSHSRILRIPSANETTLLDYYNDVIMSATASQITSLTIVYSVVCSGTDERKPQTSASMAFVRGIHRWPTNTPHKGPVTRKMISFDDVIM